MDFKDIKKKAKDFAEDSNEVFKDLKKKANPKKLAKALNPEKIVDSIGDAIGDAADTVSKKTREGGDVIVNVTDNVKKNVSEQFEDLAKATSSAYNSVSNSISDGVDSAKNYSPDKLISGMFKKVWKEDDKFLGLTITRGQKIYYSLSFIVASVLFLGMDLSLLFVDHEFENVKYSVFFFIWTFSFLLGIRILDSAIPEQFFEKKTKTVRLIAVVIYAITLITSVVLGVIFKSWTISIVAFVVHFISFAWLTTTHMPTFKGINLSYFTEKSPLLFSSFYHSVEK